MKTLTKLAGLYLLLCISAGIYAQDIELAPLTFNPAVNNEWTQLKAKGALLKPSKADTIPLGNYIFDDFSYAGPFPDPNLWLDKYVFINRTFAYCPPSLGVATFDGLNEKGYPYDFTAPESSSEGADTLTSKPIDLAFLPGDSVMFSFSYQVQGLGNAPAAKDSLVLEFRAPGKNWSHIWSKKGSGLIFTDTVNWSTVKVYITDPAFLKKGFQFRLRNYATVSGSFDHWHIDYVYLVNTKNFNVDFKDITYVYNLPSAIKTYQVMPFKQYTAAFAKDWIVTPVRNNNKDSILTNYAYSVKDDMGNVLYASPTFGYTLKSYTQSGYHLDSLTKLPVFPSPLNRISSFYLEAYHKKENDFKVENDTVRSEQKFGYYYAYDDGTAESAFGLKKANSSLAIKFELNVDDTLRYVDIYFNPKLINATITSFNLKVWAAGNGQPGAEIASSRLLKPNYYPGVNNIIRYAMDAPLVLPAGVYYVGFFQAGNVPLNIGMDMNNNNQFNTFYKSGLDAWNTMPYAGAAILHPVFGKDSTLVSVPIISSDAHLVDIYPNPVKNDLLVRSTDSETHQLNYTIYDVFGRTIKSEKLVTPAVVDVSELENGIYFIQLQEGDSNSTLKFIKIE
jgi:hypothetical protein